MPTLRAQPSGRLWPVRSIHFPRLLDFLAYLARFSLFVQLAPPIDELLKQLCVLRRDPHTFVYQALIGLPLTVGRHIAAVQFFGAGWHLLFTLARLRIQATLLLPTTNRKGQKRYVVKSRRVVANCTPTHQKAIKSVQLRNRSPGNRQSEKHDPQRHPQRPHIRQANSNRALGDRSGRIAPPLSCGR